MTSPWHDTIAAVSTAPGRGGVALIRISGDRAPEIAAKLGVDGIEARESKLAIVKDASGRPLDRVLATRFEAPASFTGEHVVELSCHGGALVPALLLDAACAAGARVAEPGEFTKRAYLNGKLDLIQAEATLDLIDSTSLAHHQSAMAQLRGVLSERVERLRRVLLDLQAALSYDIDFPEEDDGPVPPDRILSLVRRVENELDELLATAPEGERLRNGVLTVIAGAPNVGKSSLFNELQGFQRAIVTEVAGTTRDAIEVDIAIDGYPFRLVDTAGIRTDAEPIEKMGIEIARGFLNRADLVLLCIEAGAAASPADQELIREAAGLGVTVCVVSTKADLDRADTNPFEGWSGAPSMALIRTSTVTGQGMSELREALVEASFAGLRAAGEPALVTRARQVRALEAARAETRQFRSGFSDGYPAEVASTHIQTAVVTLEELIGATDVEDVLETIFKSFCVGK